jgi:hypothetical protein
MPDFTGGQFPSLDGNAAAEVAQRTEPETSDNWFRKVFTVHNRAHTRDLPPDHEMHLTNFVGVLQSALQQGLHPKAAPELESETDHPSDKNSTNLTYRVQVVPAVADVHAETTVTPSNLAAVLANPAALQPVPVLETPAGPTRWETGETGTDEATETPETPAETAPAPEAPAPALEPVETPTEPVEVPTPAAQPEA